jgi:hypothetical protein
MITLCLDAQNWAWNWVIGIVHRIQLFRFSWKSGLKTRLNSTPSPHAQSSCAIQSGAPHLRIASESGAPHPGYPFVPEIRARQGSRAWAASRRCAGNFPSAAQVSDPAALVCPSTGLHSSRPSRLLSHPNPTPQVGALTLDGTSRGAALGGRRRCRRVKGASPSPS